MTAPSNTNVMPMTAMADVRKLESDIRYQLRRAPFGLTQADLCSYLNADDTRTVSTLSVGMAVDRLVKAGTAKIEQRGGLAFICASVQPARPAPPASTTVHRNKVRALGDLPPRVPMTPGLSRRLADPVLVSEAAWDGLQTALRGADRALETALMVLWLIVIALALATFGAWKAGWL